MPIVPFRLPAKHVHFVSQHCGLWWELVPLQGAVHRLFTRQARSMLIVSFQCIISRPRSHSCNFRAMTSFQVCKCYAIVKSHPFRAVARQCNEQIVELHTILETCPWRNNRFKASHTIFHRTMFACKRWRLVFETFGISFMVVDQAKQTFRFPKIKLQPSIDQSPTW